MAQKVTKIDEGKARNQKSTLKIRKKRRKNNEINNFIFLKFIKIISRLWKQIRNKRRFKQYDKHL